MANPPQARSDNERLSLGDRLYMVLDKLDERRDEVANVLPPDIKYDTFHATVNQALRNNPDILDAAPMSIVNSCIKAAYDGLRLDGKEAALVTHKVKVAKNPDRYEVQAQYFPMVFGMIQQILRGGEVLALEAEVIYEKDYYRIIRGTDARIEHEPYLEGNPGKMVAVYSVATLKSGVKTTAFLRSDQVIDVMKSSRSGWHEKDQKPIGVWARWPRQMWIKTMIRFHRKSLPLGDRPIPDGEADEMFPDMGQPKDPLRLPDRAPERPTRQRQALPNNSGTEGGHPLDLGSQPVREEEEPMKVVSEKKPAKQEQQKTVVDEPLPSDDAEWDMWRVYVENAIKAATSPEVINSLAAKERSRIEAADKDLRDAINAAITDALTELASGAQAGDTAPSDGKNSQGRE